MRSNARASTGKRDAVGLGHLGGERRHRDGEGDGAMRRRALGRTITAEPRPQRDERVAHDAAFRVDADTRSLWRSMAWHTLIGIRGQLEGPGRRVAESSGKVGDNCRQIYRAMLRRCGRAVDASRNAPIADAAADLFERIRMAEHAKRRKVALLDRPRRHLHRRRRARTRRQHPRPQALVGEPGRLRRCGAGGHPAVPRRRLGRADPGRAHRRRQDGHDRRHQRAVGAQGRSDAARHHART